MRPHGGPAALLALALTLALPSPARAQLATGEGGLDAHHDDAHHEGHHESRWILGVTPTVWSAVCDHQAEALVGGGVLVERPLFGPLALELELRGMRAPHATEVVLDLMPKLGTELGQRTEGYIGAGPSLVFAFEDEEELEGLPPGEPGPQGSREKTHIGVAFALGAMTFFRERWGLLYQFDFAVFPEQHNIFEVGVTFGAVMRI